MWRSEGGVSVSKRNHVSFNQNGIQQLLRCSADVPSISAIRRRQALQETCERQRKQRSATLNNSRHISPSDVSDDVITDEDMVDDPANAELCEVSESGELGGAICPVCFRHWYSVCSGGIICEQCKTPVKYSGSLDALRSYIRDINRDHDLGCTSYLSFGYVSDKEVGGYNLLCACTQCDYLHVVL